MTMIATGTLYKMFEAKQVSDRFSKREFVVELTDNPRYPQYVMFQATNAGCSQLDGVNLGDGLRIEFDLRGREWKSPNGEIKYFTTLDAFKIEVVSRAAPRSGPAEGGIDEDIPF